MKFALTLLIGMTCIVLKTTFLFRISTTLPLFDLLLPLIAYISIFGPMVQSIALIIVFGGLMDAISGSPFGLYIVSYLWVLVGVRGSMYLLDAGSLFLFPLILALGIMLQNVLFAFCAHGFSFEAHQLLFLLKSILVEVTLGLIIAPFFLLLFNFIYLRYGQWAAQFKGDGRDVGG
jgi:hypothetical protein